MFTFFNQITEGERITLTLWFSRDSSHDEDAKLISFLSQGSLDNLDPKVGSHLPMPASNSMYWFPPDEASVFKSGFDIRCAKLHVLGLDLYSSSEQICQSSVNSGNKLLESLMEPLQLARGDQLFEMKFINVLHVFQVPFLCYLCLRLLTSNLMILINTDSREVPKIISILRKLTNP